MPRPEPVRALLFLTLAGLLLAAGPRFLSGAWLFSVTPAWADEVQPTRQALQAVQGALDDARKNQAQTAEARRRMAAEAERLRKLLVDRAAAAQAKEADANRLERRVAELTATAAAKEAALGDRKATLSRLLSALIRLSRRPSLLLFARPQTTLDFAHAGLAMKALVPRLNQAAGQLGRELAALAAIKAKAAVDRRILDETLKALASDRAAIAGLLATKAESARQLTAAYDAESRKVAALAAKAKSIEDLLAAVEAQEKAAADARAAAEVAAAAEAHQPPPPVALSPTARFESLKGKLDWPVAGQILSRFGEHIDPELTERGYKLATRPGAQVISPADAQVAFAGPFRGYGELLILAQGDGYHLLIAGMGHIDVSVGQQVSAGEPVGEMGDQSSPPTVYVELRHNGDPVDLSAWLTAGTTKVSG